jgi:hypothetical protein
MLALCLSASAAYSAQPSDASPAPAAVPLPSGGPCTYKHTPGTVAVAAVLRSSAVTIARFVFRPDNASEALRTDSDLEVEFSGSPLQAGSTFAAVRSQILSGSCMPLDYVATIGGRSERLSYHAADGQ